MPQDGRAFDGSTMVFGQDCDLDPSYLDATVLARAVNRTFRGGKNRTRPPFLHRPFIFSNDDDRRIVTQGNLQGATFYSKTNAGALDCLIASIAGNIYRFSLVNQSFQVDLIMAGNNPSLLETWFCQAQDWMYVQNGLDLPIFWNGIIPSSAIRSTGSSGSSPQMPVGTQMVYAFGRVLVADAYNSVTASDIIYGTGFNITSNTQNFTENTYPAEGGSFGMPANLGHLTGMVVTPSQGQGNLYGQGLVLVFGDNGCYGLDVSGDRANWKTAQIQSTMLIGEGCIAPKSLVNANNRTIFRSDDGISVYQNLAIDQAYTLSFAKFSQAINPWLDAENKELLRYNNIINFSNRVFSTVMPQLALPSISGNGSHRYHQGMMVLDLDRSAEKLSGQQISWEGLWTGIRPTALVNGRFNGARRAFVFSYDADGQNRIYEIANSVHSGNDFNDQVNGNEVQTKWFYCTKRYDWSSSENSNSFEMKKIVGGEMHISEIRDRVSVESWYRSDNRPDFYPLLAPTPYGPKLSGWNFTAPRWKRFKFLTPKEDVPIGQSHPTSHGLQHQLMVSGQGAVRVDRVRAAMAPGGNDPNVPVGDDTNKIDNEQTTTGVLGLLKDDFEYLIVPKPS